MTRKCLLLFAKASVDSGLADPDRLSSLLAGSKKDLQVSWAYLDDLVYSITNDDVDVYDHRNGRSLTEYTVVYFRYWGIQQGHAIAAARICKIKGIPFIDAEVLRPGSQNKITQYVNLYQAKVSIPRSLIGSGMLLVKSYSQHGFDFPLIMKDKSATRGQSNYLVKSAARMQEIITQNPDVTFVLQEFIPNSGDYRVVVMGNEVKLVIERKAQASTHLNNTSQGGSALVVPVNTLPNQVLTDCVRAARFFGRNVAGVDIVKSDTDGKYYCFEVNRAPQIEHASFEHEKADLLAEYLASF